MRLAGRSATAALVVVAGIVAGALIALVLTGGVRPTPSPFEATSSTAAAPNTTPLPPAVRDCVDTAQQPPIDACVLDLLVAELNASGGLDIDTSSCAARAIIDRFGVPRLLATMDGSRPFTEAERPAVADALSACTPGSS